MWLCGNEKPVKESYELEKVRVGVRQEELRGVAGGVGVCVCAFGMLINTTESHLSPVPFGPGF